MLFLVMFDFPITRQEPKKEAKCLIIVVVYILIDIIFIINQDIYQYD